MAKIKYPTKFDGWIHLFANIIEKHSKDGDKSLLKDLRKLIIEDVNKSADSANDHHKKAEGHDRLSQDSYDDRDRVFDPVKKEIRRMGKFLKAQHSENPAELGKWGFDIVGN